MDDQTQPSTLLPDTVSISNSDTSNSNSSSSSNNNNKHTIMMASGPLTCHALRLPPGSDLVQGIQDAAQRAMVHTHSQSCCILTAVGSLSAVTLRMASAGSNLMTTTTNDTNTNDNNNHIRTWDEPMEVVSLVGTLTFTHKHLHMSVSDRYGTVFGGHVMAGTIFTTLELVLGTLGGVAFQREMDPQTGYGELVVSSPQNE